MKVKTFTAKLFGNKSYIKADGKTPFQYSGKLAVCYSADYVDNMITAYIEDYTLTVSAEATPLHELEIFEVNSKVMEHGIKKIYIPNPEILEYDGTVITKADGSKVVYNTAKEALVNVQSGETIKLNEDVILDEPIELPEDVEIDLNGNTLTIA